MRRPETTTHEEPAPTVRAATPAVTPDLAEIDVPADLRAEIEELMSRYPDRHSAALPALAAAQRCTAGARRRRSTRWPR